MVDETHTETHEETEHTEAEAHSEAASETEHHEETVPVAIEDAGDNVPEVSSNDPVEPPAEVIPETKTAKISFKCLLPFGHFGIEYHPETNPDIKDTDKWDKGTLERRIAGGFIKLVVS